MQANEHKQVSMQVMIPADDEDGQPQRQLEGMLELPGNALGLALFAHGSGSGRFSPRNNFVAVELRQAGIGTLLLDLLSQEEESNVALRFDIPLLTERLGAAADWVGQQEATRSLPLALFGASTGAAAALRLAALRGSDITAVVSRGGRPDLAGRDMLAKVVAPTLLIVGGQDHEVIRLNHLAYEALHCEKRVDIVAGATHLFEEPGRLEEVAMMAATWFATHFKAARHAGAAHRHRPHE
jgi:putative phosphoribosyl transferase